MREFWQDKSVFLTGHTGFKGSWFSSWLLHLGARVTGVSLEPATTPALFDQLELMQQLTHYIEDIRNRECIESLILATQPDVIFHLAAQPLVRYSYHEPIMTWETNVLGTINVLEATRNLDSPCAVILITTDKCYENREWLYGYRETDPLGGYDPYSSSKAAAELAIASWRRSFFNPHDSVVGIASARAGNVIGGGDWATDRILPDVIRALQEGKAIPVRSPGSTRPWQHVLEPLSGYLLLAERIYLALIEKNIGDLKQLCTAFNFGPDLSSNRSVKALVTEILQHWPGEWQDCSDPTASHEAGLLNLVIDKAYHQLGWQPRWDFETTIARTVRWYRQVLAEPSSAKSNLLADILSYERVLLS